MMDKYELGISFPGHPTEEQEVAILQAALDKYGDDRSYGFARRRSFA